MTTSKKSAKAAAAAANRYKYTLKFHPAALDEWHALDNSIRQPLKKALAKRLDNPHVSSAQLRSPLNACYKIKLRKLGIRLVYEIEDAALVVCVLAVDKREKSAAYLSATERLRA